MHSVVDCVLNEADFTRRVVRGLSGVCKDFVRVGVEAMSQLIFRESLYFDRMPLLKS